MSQIQIRMLSFMVLLLVAFLPAQTLAQGLKGLQDKWLTYTDPRFDFSIQYPANWYVLPRDDSDYTDDTDTTEDCQATKGSDVKNDCVSLALQLGSVVTFSDVDLKNADAVTHLQFVVGHYLAEFEPTQSLSDWTDAYETVSNGTSPENAYKRYEKISRNVDNNKEALTIKGESVLLEFQVTNVPNEKLVWFIWTNISESASPEERAIYEQVVTSFKLGENSPKSLPDIYGDNFKPQPLEPRRVANSLPKWPDLQEQGLVVPLAGVINLPSPASSWKAPIATGTNYSVVCGSPFHQDTDANKRSLYATDISMNQQAVKSSYTSWVDFAGWANGGWGNLVTASTDNLFSRVYTPHYAHLKSISVVGGQKLGTGSHVGTSGNTGTTAYHLHFHVRSSGDSVNLTGMGGFFPNSLYPSSSGTCGSVQRST